MESSLESILSGTPAQITNTEATTTEQVQEQPEEVKQEETGEQDTGTPPERPQKDDPLEKHRKGLEAAAAAERKKRQDAEARAEAAERRARELEQLQQQRQQAQQREEVKEDDQKPLRQQYATEDEWLDARDAWRDRQREREAEARKQEEQAKSLYEKTENIYAQASVLEGFDRAAFDRLPLTKPMVEALIESEHAPALMHFMSTNPADVARIAGLSATKQVQELARIEDKLNTAPTKEEPDEGEAEERKPLPKTLTQARNAKGRFEPTYSGPTPLNAILASK